MFVDQVWNELSRRRLFAHMGTTVAGMALHDMLGRDVLAARASNQPYDVKPRLPMFPSRARRVIQLFMHGGPSQVDLLDPKPALEKYDGQLFPGSIDVQKPQNSGGILKSPFQFARHGQSGIEVSELMPHFASCVDDVTIVRSMFTEHLNHEPALWMIHTGRTVPGRPNIGSWVAYGLGTENQDLPAYVVLDDARCLPVDGIRNWSNGWLPPIYQGTRFRESGNPVWNLHPQRVISDEQDRARRHFLAQLDQAHREQRPGVAELDARIASYELAARMQVSASDALNVEQESEYTLRMYGIDNEATASYGRRCLLARRMVERDVRYIQIFMCRQPWDHHKDLEKGLRKWCARTDKPVAGLLKDLKQRGLLDDTLVIWGGEFGRLPISESDNGRDHNRQGFTIWMAGGGVKRGHVHGATDEFGYAAVENRVSVLDFHATVLHLLGLDHKRLVYNRNGLEDRLTGVHEPHVVEEIIA